MTSSSTESKFVHCTNRLWKRRKAKSRRAAEKLNTGKWDYIIRNMPYVLLTDVMNKRYPNNDTKAYNSESSRSGEATEVCTTATPVSSLQHLQSPMQIKDVTNKQISTSNNWILNDGKPMTIRLVSDRLMSGETVSDPLITTPSSCVRDSNKNLVSHDMHDDINTVFTNDIDERTDDNETEYNFDKDNELLEENYHDNYRNSDNFDKNAYSHDSVNAHVTRITEDSGSEYCPSECSSSLSETDVNNDVLSGTIHKREQQSSKSKRASKNSSGFEISDQANESNVFCPDDVNLEIDPSKGPKGGNKKNCCFYCRKLQSKIARHLGTIHRNEPDVKKFLDLPPNNLERKRIIETIRRNGNFIHNTNSNVNDGKLVVCRRPRINKQKNAKDYTACAKCKGFFLKNSIRHHFRRCTGYCSKQNRSVMVMGRAIIGRINNIAEETLRKIVFPVLREDEITRTIRYDELIIMFGNRLCRKYRKQYHHKLIRSHLRYLGRFLVAIRDINIQVTDMQSIYHPAFYEDCIKAVNNMSGFDGDTNTYKITTTPQLMGNLLKKVGKLLISQSIKKKDYETKNDAEEFLTLLVDDFPTSVNKAALEAQEENKRYKNTELPSMDDVVKLRNYLDKKRTALCEILKERFCPNNWLELAKVTLTSVQLFNRRRAGEIEHLLVKDFKNYIQISESSDKGLFQSLSSEARKIAKKYVRFTIRGKLMRTVPVLLSADLVECIEIILKYRHDARVPAKNIYLFGLPGYNKNCFKYLDACELMRRFSTECRAERPWTLRATDLRKHLATISVALDLSENDVSDLAKHMGHAMTIHKEIYRQPVASRDIVRMSQVLEKAQGVNNDDSDEYHINDENCEHSMENNTSLSYKDETESSVNISNNSASLNMNNTRSDVEKLNSIDEDRKNRDTSLCDEFDARSYRKSAKKRNTPPYGRTKRVRWTDKEKQIIIEHFGDYMKEAKLPSIRTIQEVIARNPCLQNRSASVVKTWINNQQRNNGLMKKL